MAHEASHRNDLEMQPAFVNKAITFRDMIDAHLRDFRAAFREKRIEMTTAWTAIEAGQADINKRMINIGVRPAEREECALRINFGGFHICLWRSTVPDAPGLGDSILGDLFEGAWDKRIPRDAEGSIVLDESPTCCKYLVGVLIEKQRKANDGKGVEHDIFSPATVEPHDEVYLDYLREILRLEEFAPMAIVGNDGPSTVMRIGERYPMLRQLRLWCAGKYIAAQLLYRGSRDGFTSRVFHERCDAASSTLTLMRVRKTSGRESVVGGVSDTSWAPSGGEYKSCPGAFIFRLKDSTDRSSSHRWLVCDGKLGHGSQMCDQYKHGYGSRRSSPLKRLLTTQGSLDYDDNIGDTLYECSKFAVKCRSDLGPSFGRTALSTQFDSASAKIYPSVQITIDGHVRSVFILDVEVYALLPTITGAGCTSQQQYESPASIPDVELRDVNLFGASIARSLVHERRALQDARARLHSANETIAAASDAVRTIYGPSIAAGEEDTVVELNVRGVAMTTLRSTLQTCPDSALAIRFNEDRWPPNKKSMDDDGRRIVDCDPLCFGKLLDVLRIRKRSAWTRSSHKNKAARSLTNAVSEIGSVRVSVPQSHWESFLIMVNMYFPRCESFITTLVECKY